ncbi:calcyphosin-2-like isoform X1 [Patiria miniata]|uniref:EF-hand domain-containing protein n=2 Tax=Patiria miniata TaxID=46514 RepID=A0A913YX21_PATMI|nr:calcyphosin-2-like isoform X1 [Patiria miniata]XP_038044091.1 calcyphosin-2-like isoform X1 [Patiria miniata]XP_038044099.1 calcyphosin-2-like isoform X1 [Patiria miniata]
MDLIIHGKSTPRPTRQEATQGKSTTTAGLNPTQKGPNYSTPDAPREGPKPAALRTTLSTNNSNNKASVITQAKLDKIQKVVTPRPRSRMQYPKPEGVPSLNLGKLQDGDNSLQNPVMGYEEKLDPPDTASTVSWGYHEYSPAARSPAMNAPFALHHTPTAGRPSNRSQRPGSVPRLDLQGKHKSALTEPAVPENLPPPSDRQKQQFKQLEQDRKDELKQWSQRAGQPKKQLKAPYRTDNDADDDVDLNSSQNKQDKRVDAEALAAERRRQEIEQTVLVDQLSRSVLCDPEQNQRCDTPLSGTTSPFGQPRPKMRTLHDSKVRTTGTVTENLLDKRLTFNARIVTRSGHDALRELCGFYFDLDKTMTVYEYRQFGSKSKALPFIQRGKYCHVIGRRKGRPYVVQDISAGATLTFDSEGQPSISSALKAKPVLLIRITHVDENTKEKLVFKHGRVPYDPQEYHAMMNPPITKQEAADNKLIGQVQDSVRAQIRKRACKTLTGLGRHFKQLDKSGDGVLSKEELRLALDTYHIKVDQNLFELLWLVLDQNEDGAIDYSEFHRAFIGEMNERRKTLVRKAFQKIDANKSGTVSIDELKKFFNVQKHPHVVQGLVTASEVMNGFLELFDRRAKELTYGEFEDYYEGVSVSINNDDDFIGMVSACWTL